MALQRENDFGCEGSNVSHRTNRITRKQKGELTWGVFVVIGLFQNTCFFYLHTLLASFLGSV